MPGSANWVGACATAWLTASCAGLAAQAGEVRLRMKTAAMPQMTEVFILTSSVLLISSCLTEEEMCLARASAYPESREGNIAPVARSAVAPWIG